MSEAQLIHREFSAEVTPSGDGRTLDVRILPYNEVARVSDDGGQTFYEEQWEPGVFDHLKNAANRVEVLANFEHQRGLQGVIARGTELRDTDAALDGTFRMLNHPDADKALELVNEGVLTGVSIEAIPMKSERVDGVMRRVKARLVNIALCRTPAFAGTGILAVREAPEGEERMTDEELLAATAESVARAKDLTAKQAARLSELAQDGVITNPETIAEVDAMFTRTDIDEQLQRIGIQPINVNGVVRTPWNSASSRFTDAEYEASCLIDRGGDVPAPERCSLPVLEPNGDLNANALETAAKRLTTARATPEQKSAAARRLLRLYRKADMDPPKSLRTYAAR